MSDPAIGPDGFRATLRSVQPTDKHLELVVRCANATDRALHYIADVRATRYDPATRTLTVALSDEGREVIPGAAANLPTFRYVDPQSEVELRLRIPNRVVKLSRSAPPGEIAFEKHELSEAETVVVEIGWSDVPYYKDTRPSDDMRLPAARWEQHKARAAYNMRTGRPRRR